MMYKLFLLSNKLEFWIVRQMLKNIRKHRILKDVTQWKEIGMASTSPCGTLYETLTMVGVRKNGELINMSCSPFAVYTKFIEALDTYVNRIHFHKKAVLFWRRLPEIVENNNTYYIACRLCREDYETVEERLSGKKSWTEK